ncbi:hypothetical protein EYC95_19245 [Pseudomonas sp. BGI-2]|nr:hypothetical protein EYC95_19245 [Pseudomonas sp. BGI-2]
MWAPQNQCGSEPARDEGITFNIFVDCYTAIASRLTPTLKCAHIRFKWVQLPRLLVICFSRLPSNRRY